MHEDTSKPAAALQPAALQPATTYSTVVGAVLVELRKARGMRQAMLAQQVGVAASSWSRLETGTSALTIEHLVRAARALDVSVSVIAQQADEAAHALSQRGVHVLTERDQMHSTLFIDVDIRGVLRALHKSKTRP